MDGGQGGLDCWDKNRAKEIEMEIYLYMNPWSWIKDKAERAEEGVFGIKRTDF